MCCDVVSRFARRVVCAAVFFFTLSLHASSSVTLAWNASASPNVTSYSLRYGTVPGSYPFAINAGNALTATVTNLNAGTTYYFVVTARNSAGLDSDPSNEATYTPPGTPAPNLPPTLNALGGVTLNEDAAQQTVNLSGIGSGAANESQTLVVTASSSNPGLIPNPSITYTSPNTTGTLRFTPVANANGTATITVTVNDGQALNNLFSRTFTVTVNPVNDPPTLNSINNLTLNPSAGLQTVSLSGIGSGAANESQTLVVTASSSNPGLVPTPTVTYTSPNATGTIRFTPVANATGTATVTVTINDGQSQNNLLTRTFTVTVNATSTPPIYVEAESGTVAAPMVVATSASAANGQYVCSQTANQGTVRYPVNIPQAANYWIWCRVLSPDSGTDSFFVSVDNGAEDIYDTVDNTWSSAWQWTRVNGRTTGNPRIFTLSQGTHTFTFRGRESSTFLDALYITRDPNFIPPASGANLPPTLNAPGKVTLSEDATQQTVNLSGIGSGAANESQTLVVTASSSNSSLVPTPTVTYTSPNTTGTLGFTPVANANGTATITVTVNDGQALSNLFSRTFTVTVNPVNDPPTLNSINNLTLNPSAGLQTVSLGGIGSGAANENQTLTVTASSSNSGLVPTPTVTYTSPNATGTLRFTPVANATGSATVAVTVNDGQAQNNLLTRTFTVTVATNPVNNAPTISDIANQSTTMNTATAAIGFTVGDVETAAGSLTVTGSSGNTTVVPQSGIVFGGSGANRTVTVTPATGQTGNATITVNVSDGSLTASDTFVLTVNAAPNGLVAAYGFNEGAGTTATDASGKGNTGTINGATWTTPGRSGGALSFNGSSSLVVINDSSSLDLTTGMTLEAWVYPAVSQSGWRTVIQKEVDTYLLHASSESPLVPATGATYSGNVTWIPGSGSITVGQWTHLAGTYDGTRVRLYVNGVEVASVARTGAIDVNNLPVRIGGNSPYGEFFNGQIDEVRIYNRALNATEIQSDMNTPVGSGLTPTAVPVSYPPKIASVALDDQGQVVLRVTGGSGENYTVESSSDLQTWTQIGVAAATTGEAVFSEPVASGMRFYRAVSVPNTNVD